jgi:nitrite reductase/ring-hydroxylating ferredoxin subunit
MTDFVTVGRTDDLPAGGLAVFEVAGTRVAVANVGGTFCAFDDRCTHRGCSLADGALDGGTVTCPCHHGKFDVRTGAVLAAPPPSPVKTYRVRAEGGSLQIAL